MIALLRALAALIERDVRIAYRRKADTTSALIFFLLVTSLFPIGIGADPQLLRIIAPGVVWVAALLASMLSLARLFADDFVDGTLEQMLLAGQPLTLIAAGKIVAHWLTSGLLLSLIAPFLALQFDLPLYSTAILVASLLLGTPLLSLIGAIGAALTVGVRGAHVLVALLVLPLYVPVLIFGVGAVDPASASLGISAHLSALAAMLLAGLFLSPFAVAAALGIALE